MVNNLYFTQPYRLRTDEKHYFMRPLNVPDQIKKLLQPPDYFLRQLPSIRSAIGNLKHDLPEVSIVIPAYNEEQSLLRTLSSLSRTSSMRSIEIIVVNNNSKDKTGRLASAAGSICLFEEKQGIMYARNKGLSVAKGKYVLNADADTIYPENWVDEMIKPLEQDENIILVYGKFSFLPSRGRSRLLYSLYEWLGDAGRMMIKAFVEECILVMGFHSAFRREQGIAVDGFTHPPDSGEDGELALKLRRFGKLETNKTCYVWTSDRRILIDGGFRKAMKRRLLRYLDLKKSLMKKTAATFL